MARYFIHFRMCDKFDKDDVGIELSNLAEAREAASVALHELLVENVSTLVEAAIISDESGRELATIPAKAKPRLRISAAALS